MKTLLTAFRFNIQSEDQFQSEFRFLLSENRGEIKYDEAEKVYRFDLARQIFLERGL
jgi:hypothetical protein